MLDDCNVLEYILLTPFHMDPPTWVIIVGPCEGIYIRIVIVVVHMLLWSLACTYVSLIYIIGIGLVQLGLIESCCCVTEYFLKGQPVALAALIVAISLKVMTLHKCSKYCLKVIIYNFITVLIFVYLNVSILADTNY